MNRGQHNKNVKEKREKKMFVKNYDGTKLSMRSQFILTLQFFFFT